MTCHPRSGVLLALLAVSGPAFAQSPPPTAHPPPSHPRQPVAVKHAAPAHSAGAKMAAGSAAKTKGMSGTWIRINSHLLGTVGESTWVNLAQAGNIRFYQTGKTTFAAVGTGGSNYVSTSDPVEIQKLKAYVLAHQTR